MDIELITPVLPRLSDPAFLTDARFVYQPIADRIPTFGSPILNDQEAKMVKKHAIQAAKLYCTLSQLHSSISLDILAHGNSVTPSRIKVKLSGGQPSEMLHNIQERARLDIFKVQILANIATYRTKTEAFYQSYISLLEFILLSAKNYMEPQMNNPSSFRHIHHPENPIYSAFMNAFNATMLQFETRKIQHEAAKKAKQDKLTKIKMDKMEKQSELSTKFFERHAASTDSAKIDLLLAEIQRINLKQSRPTGKTQKILNTNGSQSKGTGNQTKTSNPSPSVPTVKPPLTNGQRPKGSNSAPKKKHVGKQKRKEKKT